MGTVGDAGRIAGGSMAALKGQPLSLALVVMNMALLLLVFYSANDQNEGRRHMATLILKQQRETEILLSKCIDVDGVRKIIEAITPR